MKFSNFVKTVKGQEMYNKVKPFSQPSHPSVFAEATPISYRSKLHFITVFMCMLAFAKQDDFFS